MEYNDITLTGYNNYNDLQDLNDEYQGISNYLEDNPPKASKRGITLKLRLQLMDRQEELRKNQNLINNGYTPYKGRTDIGRFNPDYFNLEDLPYMTNMAQTETPFGESRYDKNVLSDYEIEHIGDIRAISQSGFNKLMAGTAKAAVLAGTTFLDGTVGLVYGIGSAIVNGDAGKLFDNEISNGLLDVNKFAERILPNYRSEIENSRSWYQNLGTANFWADFLKLAGFTIGAYYSGAAWTKVLKAITLVKSPIGARIAGSFISGVNEGRIEANQIQNEHYNRETELLDIAFNKEKDDVMRRYYNGQLSDTEANTILESLYTNNDINKLKIKDNSDLVGLVDLAINVPILTLDNMLMFGKAYSRGFNNANKAVNSKRTIRQWFRDLQGRASENLGILENEVALNVEKTAAGYGWNTITKGLAALKGMGHFLREGNEEMAQAWASEFASALYQPDSPDAYYQALYDPNALDNTKSFYQSAILGFSNSYGNLDRWLEFVMGGLIGLLGTVTFGKNQNQSPDTYAGKGRRVGITGGLFGEFAAANYYNQKGQANVDFMNNYVQSRQKDFENKIRHFAMSDHYNSLMNGWAEESNKFEYQNAKDNDDFEAYTRFNNAGRLQDFKDMINQDFSDLSDEDLDLISKSQDSNDLWKNSDGTYMSETPEGRAIMREKLEENRKDLLKGLEYFEEAYESIVNATNDNLTDEQNLELSWLKWKVNKFKDRFKDIKTKNKSFFELFKEGLLEYVDNFDDSIDESKLSETVDENDPTKLSERQKYQFSKRIVNNARELIKLVNYLENSEDALDFQRKAGVNYNTLNQIIDEDTYDLFAGQTSMTYDQYRDTIQNILDAAKLGIAANEFDERLQQYMKDPSNIEKQHSKIRKKIDDVVDKVKANKVANDISEMSDEILSIELDNDNIIRDNDGSLRTADGTVITKGLSEEKTKEINDKFDRAEKLKKEKDEVKSVVRNEDFDIDMPITNEDIEIVNSAIDLMFEDGNRIIDIDLDTVDDSLFLSDYEMETDDLSDEERQDLISKRKEIIMSSRRKASENIESTQSQKQQTPKGTPNANSEEKPVTSGEDGVTVTPPVNEDETKQDNSKQSQEEGLSAFIDKDELDSDSNSQVQKSVQETSSSFDDVMKPVSQLPLSLQRDSIRKKFGYDISRYDYIPFIDVLRKLADEGKHFYSEEVERYMFAMQDYLNQTNAFENRKKGYTLRGHSVTFITSKSVNDKAGINIVFIRDEAGNIIGSLIPSKYGKKDAQNTQSARNIELFITDEYEDDIQVIKDKNGNPIQSLINNDYIGILPISKEWNTVLDVFGDNVEGIKFGVVKETGKNNSIFTKKTDIPDTSVRTPSKSKIGQVFLLLDATSSDNPKVTVNMFIPRFNDSLRLDKNGDDTYFYKHLIYVLDKIVALNNRNGVTSDDICVKIKHELNLLFSGLNFGVERDPGTNKIKSIHIGDSQGEAETTYDDLYSLQRDGELDSDLLYKLISGRNFPINVSLGMINLDDPVDGIDVSYNEMIAEIALVKIVPNMTHTVDDFFTIDLIDENGKQVAAEPKRKSSDKSVNDQYISNSSNTGVINKFNYDYVDNQTGIVYAAQDDIEEYLNNPNTKSGAKERILDRAEAYVQIRMIDKSKQPIINLRFGDMPVLKYDTVKKELILPEEQSDLTMLISTPDGIEIETPTPMNVSGPTVLQFKPKKRQQDKPVKQPVTDNTSFSGIDWLNVSVDDANKWFYDLGGQVEDYAADWEDMSDDLKKQIFAARDIINNESLDRIMLQIGLTGESDELSSLISGKPMFRRFDKYAAQSPNSTQEEMNWLKQVYPELIDNERVRIVKGLIRIQDSETPDYAWGMFKSGVIYLSDMAAQGTLYHESFHAVAHTLLTQGEFNKALDIVRRKNPNLDNIQLEEILAEEFRGYMLTEYTGYNDNLIVRIFKQLKNIIKSLFNKQYALQNLYYRISQGAYSRRNARKSNVSRSSVTSNNMTAEMQLIKQQAIADGTFMKAPNGNPTNLTERQWLQVRTKAFKKWFGDWEKYAPTSDSSKVEEQLALVFERIPELSKIGSIREYAAYLADKFPNSVDRSIYWHGTNEDLSEGFKSAKKGKGSGAPETQSRNDFYLAKQAWTVLQYVNGVNRNSVDKNGFAHWNKLWWELKEIMSNGRRENNNWKDIVIGEETVRQGIPNKRGVFNRDKGGGNGKWLSERKADYGYENKSDKEFFEDILGIQWGKDTFNTWTKRNAEAFKALEKTQKGIYPAIINTQNPIREKGQNTYYEEQRGLFTQAEREGNDAILGENTDNEFGSDVAVVLNASENNVHFLGTKEDIEGFKKWLEENRTSKVVDENGEPKVVYHGGKYKKGEKFSVFDVSKSENRFWLSTEVGNKSFFTDNDYLAYKMAQPDYYQREVENLEGSVYEVFLNLKNPLVLNAEGRRADFFIDEHKQELKDNEEIIVNNIDEDGINVTDYVVSNSNQIKSATDNNGEFSTNNDNIYYRRITNDSFNSHLLRNVWSKINEKPMSVGSEIIKWLVTGKQKFADKEFGKTRYFINLAKQYHADYNSQSEYDTTGRTTQYNQDEVLKEVQNRIDQSNLNGLVRIITNEFGVPELVLVQDEASKLYDYFTKSWNQQGRTLENNNLIKLNREAIDFFSGLDSMTASDVLQKIYQSESGFSDLAQYMSEKLNSLNNVKVKLVGEEEFWHLEGQNHKGQGIFDPNSNTIYINEANTYNNGMFNRILIHEIIHAMAFNAKKDATLLAKIQSILNDARKLIEKAEGKPIEQLLKDRRTAYTYYGLTNVDEFISECLSNPEFIRKLNQYGGTSIRSIYNRIKNWILNIFKLKNTSDIYDRAVEFIDDMLNNQYDESDSSFDTRKMYEDYYNSVVGSQEYYEGIQEYHREKNWYENLGSDQIQYIKDNNVGYFEYLNMTNEEKNNFWMCQG